MTNEIHFSNLGFNRFKVFRGAVLVDGVSRRVAEQLANREISVEEAQETMRKHGHEDSPIAAPGAGWRLVAKRQIQTTGKIYPVGAEVPVAALGKNYAALLSSHFVGWVPGGTEITVKARKLPPPPARPKGNPAVQIVDVPNDPVASWKQTLQRMTALCDGDAGRADCLLMANEVASELFRRATRLWCIAEAKRQGVQSVSPSPGF